MENPFERKYAPGLTQALVLLGLLQTSLLLSFPTPNIRPVGPEVVINFGKQTIEINGKDIVTIHSSLDAFRSKFSAGWFGENSSKALHSTLPMSLTLETIFKNGTRKNAVLAHPDIKVVMVYAQGLKLKSPWKAKQATLDGAPCTLKDGFIYVRYPQDSHFFKESHRLILEGAGSPPFAYAIDFIESSAGDEGGPEGAPAQRPPPPRNPTPYNAPPYPAEWWFRYAQLSLTDLCLTQNNGQSYSMEASFNPTVSMSRHFYGRGLLGVAPILVSTLNAYVTLLELGALLGYNHKFLRVEVGPGIQSWLPLAGATTIQWIGELAYAFAMPRHYTLERAFIQFAYVQFIPTAYVIRAGIGLRL